MFLQVKDPTQVTAILIDGNDARRGMFDLTLGSSDISLAQGFASVDAALAAPLPCDLAIYYASDAGPAAVSDLERLSAARMAAILVLLESTARDDIERLLDTGADHVLPLGLQADRLIVATVSALALGRKRRRAQRALDQSTRALDEAKQVARAKMILMGRHGVGEDEAHRRVQKMSMERNLPMAEMAKQIIDAEDLLC